MYSPSYVFWNMMSWEMLRPQYFHNKSQVVSYYWFKFEPNSKITFLLQQQLVTTRHLEFVVKILWKCYGHIISHDATNLLPHFKYATTVCW